MADSSGRHITIIVTQKIFTKPSLVVVSVQFGVISAQIGGRGKFGNLKLTGLAVPAEEVGVSKA